MGSQKAAASNVESVFSGVGGMVQKATTLGAELTENYTICHHNWLYEFLEPSDEEIIAAYVKLNGFEPHELDAEWRLTSPIPLLHTCAYRKAIRKATLTEGLRRAPSGRHSNGWPLCGQRDPPCDRGLRTRRNTAHRA